MFPPRTPTNQYLGYQWKMTAMTVNGVQFKANSTELFDTADGYIVLKISNFISQ